MTVQVRLKRGESSIRRRRDARAEHDHVRSSDPAAAPPEARPRQRHGGPSQDVALYNCHCGYVFEAVVSTTVGCPHCGGTQAW